MSLRATRLAAVLLPAALVLHEGVYGLAGGGLAGAHDYLEVVVPLAAALAASLALAALALPALGMAGSAPRPQAPFALAAALLGIFAVQELAEATVLGGGASGLPASLAAAWLALPLALLLGALSTAAIAWLERTGERLRVVPTGLWLPRRSAVGLAPPARPDLSPLACDGLAFGFARRPPPRPS